jgi:hypothetical protein
MTKPESIQDDNLSCAWGRAIRPMLRRGGLAEIAPLCLSITGFDDGVPREDPGIRDALDGVLGRAKKQTCHTVANTIFPASLWNPRVPRADFFARFERSLPRMRDASPKNRHGMYFERLVQGGPDSHANQLDFVIGEYLKRKGVRRSALQVAVYDAKQDQTTAAQRGFPCLQHVTFAPVGRELNVNAFYATQYAFERAYGNYLGLCRLGRFVAHELKLRLACVTCFTGIMLCDELPAQSKQKLARAIEAAVGSEEEES